MDHPFRSAVFGGFNRQDVLTYLENTAKESAQRQAELEKKLDEAQTLSTQQDAQLAEQAEQLARLRQENQELQSQLEQANQALSASRTQCSQHSGDLEAARREEENAQRELTAAQYELETAEGQRRQAEDEVLRLEGAVSHLESLLQAAAGTEENLAGELESLGGRLADIQARAAGTEAEIADREARASQLRTAAEAVHTSDEVLDYVIRLITATRNHPMIAQGASPRATLAVTAMAKAAALVRGRDYVIPEDVSLIFRDVVTHRLILSPRAAADPKANPAREVLRTVAPPEIR